MKQPRFFLVLSGLFVLLAGAMGTAPQKSAKSSAVDLIGKAKTADEFLSTELPAWRDLYIRMAESEWTDGDRAAYPSLYWRNAVQAFFQACPTDPAQFPASIADLRASPLLPFIPFDFSDATPVDGDFLKEFALPKGADLATLSPDQKDAITKATPPGALTILKSKSGEGDTATYKLGFAIVWYNPNSKTSKLYSSLLAGLTPSSDTQPLRCLANQMVFYIDGFYAVTGKMPQKPEDLDKKVALLNPAVWEDKKQGPRARQIWNGLVGLKP